MVMNHMIGILRTLYSDYFSFYLLAMSELYNIIHNLVVEKCSVISLACNCVYIKWNMCMYV